MVNSMLGVRRPPSYIPLHRLSLAFNNHHIRRRNTLFRLKPRQPAHLRAQLEDCADDLRVSFSRLGAKEQRRPFKSDQRWKVTDDGVPIELLNCHQILRENSKDKQNLTVSLKASEKHNHSKPGASSPSFPI